MLKDLEQRLNGALKKGDKEDKMQIDLKKLSKLNLKPVALNDLARKNKVVISVCKFCDKLIGQKEAGKSKGGLSHTACDMCQGFYLIKIKCQLQINKIRGLKKTSTAIANYFIWLHKRIEVIDNIFAFRKGANQTKGLRIKFAEE